MNQRMRELAAEAYRAVDPGPDPYNEAEVAWVGFGALERKFVELIVRECMSMCQARADNPAQGSFRDGALLSLNDIKDHFGVDV